MLGKLSKFSGGFLSKILLGALVLIFAVAGMQGLRAPQDTVVSIDGKMAVSTTEFIRAKKNIANSFLNTYPGIDIASVNLNQLALNELIKDRLIGLELQDLGMYISDDLVIQKISKNPMFHDQNGIFDKDIFHRILSSSGVKEKEFVRHIKDTIGIGFLSNVMGGFDVPDKIVRQLNMYNNQERLVELYLVKNKSSRDINVSDEEIRSYYDANKQRFTNPESRDLEYIKIKPEFFKGQLDVSDVQIDTELASMKFSSESDRKNARKGLIQNRLEQVMFETIKDIEDSIAEGKSLKEVAKRYNLSYEKVSSFAKGGNSDKLPNSNKFIEEVFSLEEGVASEVIQDSKGKEYYIANTISLKPSGVKPVGEVRDVIISEMRKDKIITEKKKNAYLVRNAVLKNASHSSDFTVNEVTLTRPEQDKSQFGIAPETLIEIFNLENIGDISSVFPTKNYGFAFAKLRKVESIQDISQKSFKESKVQLSRFLEDTVMQSFISSLYQKHKIELFEKNVPKDR